MTYKSTFSINVPVNNIEELDKLAKTEKTSRNDIVNKAIDLLLNKNKRRTA